MAKSKPRLQFDGELVTGLEKVRSQQILIQPDRAKEEWSNIAQFKYTTLTETYPQDSASTKYHLIRTFMQSLILS